MRLSETNSISRSFFSLLAILAASSALEAGIFMELGDVPGQSTEKKHQNWIVCDGLSFGVQRPASTGAQKDLSGAARFSEITLSRRLDVSSCDLLISAANGQITGEATIELTNATGEVYLRIVLRDVAVTGYSVTTSGGEVLEEIKLTYSMIRMSYFAIAKDGSRTEQLTRAWSVERNTEI